MVLTVNANIEMKKSHVLLTVLLMQAVIQALPQVSITNDNSIPDNSAMLDVKSTNKGLLVPRMTTAQRNTITNPAEGLLIFNVTTMCFNYYFGHSWKSFCGATEPEFQCGMKMTDSRDGKMYNTVKIGTRCWMAENINVGKKIPGSMLPSNNDSIEKYCYNDDTLKCNIYGALYTWDEMMGYLADTATRGICPAGWHIPSDHEWKVIEGTVDSHYGVGDPEWDREGFRGSDAGAVLKSTSIWMYNNTDLYGFSALPGGMRDNGGYFDYGGYHAWFWSSTEHEVAGNAWGRRLDQWINLVERNIGWGYVLNGFSCRCIQD
jgi:uncharacterized protein (TIGR02145 family)